MAKRVKKSETFSKGCVIQMVGLLFPFIGALAGPVGSVIGAIVMLVFVFVGWRTSTKWFCGKCGTPIAGKRVDICPTCKARLE